MRPTALVLLGAMLASGVGCRMASGERGGLFGRLTGRDSDAAYPASRCGTDSRPLCSDTLASSRGPVATPYGLPYPPPPGWAPDAGFGNPIYPSGDPLPIRPGGSGTPPANELPYPMIPSPGVPETPAQPMPAIPSTAVLPAPSVRTTGDAKDPK